MWDDAINDYCAWLRAGGASAATLKLRRHYLRRLSEQHRGGPWDMTGELLVAFCATEHWRPETRKTARGTVRSFYGWAVDTDRLVKDPSRRLPPVRVPPTVPRPAPDVVLAQALMAAPPRERLMLMLAAYAGLRRGEVARVHTHDVVGDGLRVNGKGGRTRCVPLPPVLVAALAEVPPGWVFPGRIDGHLSSGHVGKVLTALLGGGWTAHTLRHRFASRAYAAQRDLRAVQELLGHSKPETTARYTALPDDALRAAVLAAVA